MPTKDFLPYVIMMAYIVIMIRTQIQLEDEQSRALQSKSVETSKSVAQLIREAVAVYLVRSAVEHQPLERIAGKFRRRSGRGLKDHDKGWADSIR